MERLEILLGRLRIIIDFEGLGEVSEVVEKTKIKISLWDEQKFDGDDGQAF